MWAVSEFEVEVRTCAGTSVRRYITRSADDIEQDVSLGETLVWINTVGMAWVRLLEHDEQNPRDPARARLSGEVGGFLDEL